MLDLCERERPQATSNRLVDISAHLVAIHTERNSQFEVTYVIHMVAVEMIRRLGKLRSVDVISQPAAAHSTDDGEYCY